MKLKTCVQTLSTEWKSFAFVICYGDVCKWRQGGEVIMTFFVITTVSFSSQHNPWEGGGSQKDEKSHDVIWERLHAAGRWNNVQHHE